MSSRIRKLGSVIFLSAWVLWFLRRIYILAFYTDWHPPMSTGVIGFHFGAPILVGGGAWLAWLVYENYRSVIMLEFGVVCAILGWKFFVGAILIYMLPAMGGHSFMESVSWWWLSSGPLGALFPPLLLLLSVSYWPAYCKTRKMGPLGQAAPPQQ